MSEQLSRRRFMAAGAGLGAVGLGLGAQAADEPAPEADAKAEPEALVAVVLDDHEDLDKVGGSAWAELPDGTEIVIGHSEEQEFVCCGGRCSHANGVLQYDHETKAFVCADHGSRFDLQGQVVSGPATRPIASYPTDRAVVVRQPDAKK